MPDFNQKDYDNFFDEDFEAVNKNKNTPNPKTKKSKKEKMSTGKGCALGCGTFLAVFLLLLILTTMMNSCGNNSESSNNATKTEEATETPLDYAALLQKVQSLNFQLHDKFVLDTVSNEEKIAEANRIEELITPDYQMLMERNKKDNEDKGDFNYGELHVYEAYGALITECNAVRDYLNGNTEALEDVEKLNEAVIKDINAAKEKLGIQTQ